MIHNLVCQPTSRAADKSTISKQQEKAISQPINQEISQRSVVISTVQYSNHPTCQYKEDAKDHTEDHTLQLHPGHVKAVTCDVRGGPLQPFAGQ